MKKKPTAIIFATLICALCVFGFTACKKCEHEYGEWTVTTAAACENAGEQSRTCAKCGKTQTESIDALGHDMQTVSAKAATCESEGWNSYEQCSRCDHNTKQVIAALGHEFAQSWTNDESGHWHACTHEGCQAKSNEAEHSEVDHYCSVCELKTSEHVYGEAVYDWSGDYSVCTATRYCSKCSADTEGHTQTATAKSTENVTRNADCLNPEITDFTAVFEESWATEQIAKDIQTKDALNHKQSETWQSDALNHWKKCENTDCTKIFDKASHTYSDETFTCFCGYKAQGFVVTYSEEDDGYAVIGYSGDETEITVPSSYNPGNPYGEKSIVTVANIFDSNSYLSGYKKLTKVVLSDGIKSIEERAFFKCDKLSSVVIPSTVTEIGYMAFDSCTALTTINLTEGITKIENGAFGNSGLTEIVIPKTVTYLGGSSFEGCNKLEKITLPFIGADRNGSNRFSYIFAMLNDDVAYKYVPKSLKTVIISECINVNNSAFANCAGLQTIVFEKGVSDIKRNAFIGCSGLTSIDLSSGALTEISECAFKDCTSLKEVKLPNDLITIGTEAFKDCTSLKEVKLPNGLITIGTEAFSGCSKLVTINLPESLKTIKKSAFANCALLDNIEVPNGLTDILDTAFWGCGLTSIDLSACNLTEINIGVFKECVSLSEVKLPSGLISLKNTAFYDCGSLKSITLPSSLIEIESGAFENCSLTSIELPDSLKKIGSGAFANCTSLTEIVIPNSVTNIDSAPFSGCENITKITLPWIVSHIGYVFGAAAPNANVYYTKKLSEVVITNGENILADAFYGCSTLRAITLPSTLKSIGKTAFGECESLNIVRFAGTMGEWCGVSFYDMDTTSTPVYFSKSLYLKDENGEYKVVTHAVIPEGVTAIDRNFNYNERLTSITIPASVKNITKNAFYGCKNLVNVYYDGSIEDYCDIEYGESQYGNPMYYSEQTKTFYIKNSNGSYQKITSLIIPETVTRIGAYQFVNFIQITSITISSSVTSIEISAFFGCDGLKEIKIPDSVVNIGKYAFNYCYYLESVEISASVKTIGDGAFDNCRNLQTINFKGTRAEWEAIEKGNEWNNNTHSSLKVVCSDGEIEL